MNGKLFFVNSTSKVEIEEIRQKEYAKASGFYLDLKSLQWRESDDQSFVLAAELNGKVVSTMRGEVISDPSLLEKKLECSWNFSLPLEYPVLLLSRAATLSSHRALGLNLTLRHYFLKFAKHHNLPFVVGTFISGSPREKTLRQMGYQFFENTLGWQQSTYRSLRPVTVVALDMKKDGEHALKYAQAHLGASAFFEEPAQFPELKFVGQI